MRVVSLNVGEPRTVSWNGRDVETGIFKDPVDGRRMLRRHQLDGDRQADPNHGGEHMAVYCYPLEHYRFWARELDREDFVYGQFGENLTLEGVLENTVHVGDIFRIGGALVQVTTPRIPCYKLGIRMGMPDFPKAFSMSERIGFYFRVLEEGEIGPGDTLDLVEADPMKITIFEVNHLRFFDKSNRDAIERAMQLPALSERWRNELAGVLE